MGKKPKDAEPTAKTESAFASTSSDIFKNLFGDVSEQAPSTSIFSDANPFRRKPRDGNKKAPETVLGLDPENPSNGRSENPDVSDMKRKRRKESKTVAGFDTSERDLVSSLESKRAKKGKNEPFDLKSKQDSVVNPSFGVESSGKLKKVNREKQISGVESNVTSEKGKERKPDMGFVLNGVVNSEIDRESREGAPDGGEEKRKKKRKRNEIEREYEERRYGVVEDVERGESGLGGRVVGEKRKTVDNPAEMLVSKEGYDDDSKLLRTVFIGNLPLRVKKKALLKEFSQFGEIESVRIRSVPILDTKTPRKGAIMKKKINESVDSVHAYIVFKIEESAQASLAHNMHLVGGNHIRVDKACPPRKKLKGDNAPLYDNKRTVFVGNLPFDVKDEEVYQLFCGINQLASSIEAVRVVRDPNSSVGKGIAYVLFKTRVAANLVVKKRNLKLRDRELRLSYARVDSTPLKRKTPSTSGTDYSPAKRLAVDSSTPQNSNGRLKKKFPITYQGLRASKSGAQKKIHPRAVEQRKKKLSASKGEKSKERSHKRPAVAARKASALKGGVASKVAGKKRKMERQTPESSHQKKKAKKMR